MVTALGFAGAVGAGPFSINFGIGVASEEAVGAGDAVVTTVVADGATVGTSVDNGDSVGSAVAIGMGVTTGGVFCTIGPPLPLK